MYKNNLYVPKYLRNNPSSSTYKAPNDCYVSKFLKGTSRKGLNPYLSQNNETYDTTGEYEMIEDLIDEHIRMHGHHFRYIVRTDNTLDQIYGESIGAVFSHSFEIEMMPSDISGGMQGRDSIAAFGYNMTDTVELHVSFRRITEEIRKLNVRDKYMPQVGDLVSWDIMNVGNLMEIVYVEDKVVPFQKGNWTVVNLVCQVYNLGNSDTFDTGNEDIDFLNDFDKTYEYPQADNEDIFNEAKKNYVMEEPNIWNLDFSQAYNYEHSNKGQ